MNRQIDVSIEDVTGRSWQFEKLRTLLSFLENEASYWNEQDESISADGMIGGDRIHGLIRCHSYFENVINDIKLYSENDDWDDRTLEQKIQNLLNQSGNWLWSKHPYSEAFVQCNIEHGANTAGAFITYIVKKEVRNIQDSEWFYGIMLGYEFLRQDSDIIRRRKAEKISIGHLRNQLEQTNISLINEA